MAGDKRDLDEAAIAKDFARAVNMTPASLAKSLGGEESRSVGQVPDGKSEAVGNEEGRRIDPAQEEGRPHGR